MSWDYDRCVEYVKKNASLAMGRELLAPLARPYSQKFANISLTYYSMPDWLAIFELGPKYVGQRRFEAIAHEYRFVGQKFQGKVAALLDAVPGLGFVWDVNHTHPDDLAAFKALAPRMSMLHVSDTPLPETNYHLPIGMGNVDFADYFRAALGGGFTGAARP